MDVWFLNLIADIIGFCITHWELLLVLVIVSCVIEFFVMTSDD